MSMSALCVGMWQSFDVASEQNYEPSFAIADCKFHGLFVNMFLVSPSHMHVYLIASIISI